jgi:hypothetical protein
MAELALNAPPTTIVKTIPLPKALNAIFKRILVIAKRPRIVLRTPAALNVLFMGIVN